MKTKIGELYNKSVVVGNPNEVTKNEILLKNDVGGITLSERKDGELEDISNTPPTYPRCFIWYKAEEFDVLFGAHANSVEINEITSAYIDNLAIIKFNNDGIDQNGNLCDLDTFLNWKKGKYKEISLKEFMGECPEGDYGFIDIYVDQLPNPDISNVRTLVNDNTKKRLNHLSKNPNKANLIRVYLLEGDEKYIPIKLNSSYYTIDKENNCIIFETEELSPVGIGNEIKVSLDAEVVGQ
jgi:hypothetical protein